MDQYFKANAVLSVSCRNYMELKRGQEKFDTLIGLAQTANRILEEKGEKT